MKKTKLQTKKGFKKLSFEETKLKLKRPKVSELLEGKQSSLYKTWKASVKPKIASSLIEKRKEKELLKKAEKKAKKAEKKYKESLPKKLTDICHLYIKKRDSIPGEMKKGYCCCCKKLAEGEQFQAGHYRAKASTGILLKWHPWNIHGQCGGCNMWKRQDAVKPEYAEFMRQKYTPAQMDKMLEIKNSRSLKIQADTFFFESMIDLYKQGNEEEIIKFLESYL